MKQYIDQRNGSEYSLAGNLMNLV